MGEQLPLFTLPPEHVSAKIIRPQTVGLPIDGTSGSKSFEADAALILGKAFEVLKRKHADYGTFPVSFMGLRGLIVRLGDKFFRLHNLVWKNGNSGANNESVRDTLEDTLNYALMGILLLEGKWPKEEEHQND